MYENNLKPSLDFKTMIAILNTNPDGVAIIGTWNSMITMACEDPEGCVRLSPGMPMDNTSLASLLHCTEAIVVKTLELFGKLQKLAVKDGLIKVLGLEKTTIVAPKQTMNEKAVTPKSDLTGDALAKKREKDRIRKAKSRARQKLAQMTGTEVNDTLDTKCDQRDRECDTGDKGCDKCDNGCDRQEKATQSRTATGIEPVGNQCDSKRDTERTVTVIHNRNYNNIYPLHATNAYKPVSIYGKPDNLIPLGDLPEEYRNVINEWNKLPLPKYRGLVPDLLQNLKHLMKCYGKNTLCKTIAGIANNAFLLGAKEGKTWSVTLSWLLKPDNFAKVLSGKYQDQKYADSSGGKWHPGERLPFYLPGERKEGFTPEEQEKALRDLFVPTTPAQLKAARLVGLPGYKEATA